MNTEWWEEAMELEEWTLVFAGIGAIAAIVVAAELVVRPAVRAWRRREWDKWIQDAREFIHTVQMYNEMLRKRDAYEHLMQERWIYLTSSPLNYSSELVRKDRRIAELLNRVKTYDDCAAVWFQRLENGADDILRYEDEYVSGAIFVQWDRAMSAEFRESRKKEIEGLKQKVAAPEAVLQYHGAPFIDLSTADR